MTNDPNSQGLKSQISYSCKKYMSIMSHLCLCSTFSLLQNLRLQSSVYSEYFKFRGIGKTDRETTNWLLKFMCANVTCNFVHISWAQTSHLGISEFYAMRICTRFPERVTTGITIWIFGREKYNSPYSPLGVYLLRIRRCFFQYASYSLESGIPHKRSTPPHQHVNFGIPELLFLVGMFFTFVDHEQEK